MKLLSPQVFFSQNSMKMVSSKGFIVQNIEDWHFNRFVEIYKEEGYG